MTFLVYEEAEEKEYTDASVESMWENQCFKMRTNNFFVCTPPRTGSISPSVASAHRAPVDMLNARV